MPEKQENIVRTSIRFPGEVHEKLRNYVHERSAGKVPKDQPSIEGTVIDAVELLLASSRHEPDTKSPTATVPPKPSTKALADALKMIAEYSESISAQASKAAVLARDLIDAASAEDRSPKISTTKGSVTAKVEKAVKHGRRSGRAGGKPGEAGEDFQRLQG